jgi:hypothetical protein
VSSDDEDEDSSVTVQEEESAEQNKVRQAVARDTMTTACQARTLLVEQQPIPPLLDLLPMELEDEVEQLVTSTSTRTGAHSVCDGGSYRPPSPPTQSSNRGGRRHPVLCFVFVEGDNDICSMSSLESEGDHLFPLPHLRLDRNTDDDYSAQRLMQLDAALMDRLDNVMILHQEKQHPHQQKKRKGSLWGIFSSLWNRRCKKQNRRDAAADLFPVLTFCAYFQLSKQYSRCNKGLQTPPVCE